MKPRFFTPLSAKQITGLCTFAGKAYKAAKAREALDDGTTLDDFRRAGQLEACGVESLKAANQSHYLSIVGKWWTVIGNLEAACYAFLNEGPQNEAHRQMAWQLVGSTMKLARQFQSSHKQKTGEAMPDDEAAKRGWAYAQVIASGRFGGRKIDSLNTDELEHLSWTINNREAAHRGVGDPANRNKSQRKSRKGVQDLEVDDDQDRTKGPGLSLIARRAAQLLDSASRPR